MLTAQQIVTLGCQIAKVPGMHQQAGQLLNARLVQIALDQDLDVVRRTTTISVTAASPQYNLPANYLRAREVFYVINGITYWLDPVALEDYDKLDPLTGLEDYPYLYTTNIGTTPPVILLYPPPILAFPLTVRYMDSSVEITSPENSSIVPWFQDQRLLIKMLAEDLMDISDDARATEFSAKNDEQFRRYLRMANDKEGRTARVKKDPMTFRSHGNLLPTKLQGD